MKTWGLFAALAGVFGILAFAGSTAKAKKSSSRGLPRTERLVIVPKENAPGGIEYVFDGKPVNASDVGNVKAFLQFMNPRLESRRATLPSDAGAFAGDKYSGEAWIWPHVVPQGMGESSVWVMIDEYGRLYDLDYSQTSMWAALLANPLFQAVLAAAILATGYGIPAYAAMQAYKLRGEELSLKSIALAAGKAAVYSQCGQACAIAFDLGVGVASGKSVDDAALDAMYSNMTPEQRAAFEEGKKAYKEVTA